MPRSRRADGRFIREIADRPGQDWEPATVRAVVAAMAETHAEMDHARAVLDAFFAVR